MMYCKNCGNKMLDNAIVCTNCGTLVNGPNLAEKEKIIEQNLKKYQNRITLTEPIEEKKSVVVFIFLGIFLFIVVAICMVKFDILDFQLPDNKDNIEKFKDNVKFIDSDAKIAFLEKNVSDEIDSVCFTIDYLFKQGYIDYLDEFHKGYVILKKENDSLKSYVYLYNDLYYMELTNIGNEELKINELNKSFKVAKFCSENDKIERGLNYID